jgi:hypothetical protein
MRYIHARARPLLAAALLVTSAPALYAQEPVPAAAAPTALLRGDVDGDGRVTTADAAAVRAYLVRGTLPPGRAILPAGDANGDGRVTAADAALISRFAAGMDVSRFGLGRPMPGSAAGGRTFIAAEYECIVDVGEGTTNCRLVGPGPKAGDAKLDLLPGVGPLTFVSSWTHSRGSTADEDTSVNTLRFVSNMVQPIGTTDGINPASPGNRLFFTTPPYVASVSSGTVAGASIALVTPDDTATFSNPENTSTYTDRPYYEYAGMLEQGDTSTSRTIQYIYSANVKSFGYKYRVSAPVQYEFGWITLSPSTLPTLNPGSPVVTLTGTEYDAYGTVQANGITWSSSNPSVATVNATTGEVTAVAVGTTTITATSSANAQRTGSREITVTNVNTWEGDVSSDWQTAGNWDANVVPGSATVAIIPAAGTLPNLPVLTANAQVLDLTVGSARTLGLGGFTLQAGGDVTATGTISNGVLQLSGSDADWQGTVDDVVISGAGFLAGATTATGPVSVTGSLTIADQALSIAIP